MSPDPGKAVEVGRASSGCRQDRRRTPAASTGTGLVHTSSPRTPGESAQRLPLLVPHVDGRSERRALDLPGVHRPRGIADHETAAQVGAAADRRQVHVGLDVVVDVVEPLGGQRRSGRCDGAQRRTGRSVSAATSTPALAQASRNLALVPNKVTCSASARSHSAVGPGWNGEPSYSTIVAPEASAVDQPVPHHPAAGGVVEDPVTRTDVAVQLMFGQLLQQHARTGVDDALGLPGRAGRVQDESRLAQPHPFTTWSTVPRPDHCVPISDRNQSLTRTRTTFCPRWPPDAPDTPCSGAISGQAGSAAGRSAPSKRCTATARSPGSPATTAPAGAGGRGPCRRTGSRRR